MRNAENFLNLFSSVIMKHIPRNTNQEANPSEHVSRKLSYKALKFVILDYQLYHRIVDGVLLKCLNQ